MPKAIFLLLVGFFYSCGDGRIDVEEYPDSSRQSGDQQTGPQGPDGKPGAQGPRGPAGRNTGIALFDSNGGKIGYKFNDGEPADVFLTDGRRALIDRQTGALKAPLFGFFCMYESGDCSGTCYVYDSRWLNVIVLDQSSQTRIAPNGSVNQGAKNMNSYVDEAGSCIAAITATLESYETELYQSPFTFPLNAPLYWSLEQ